MGDKEKVTNRHTKKAMLPEKSPVLTGKRIILGPTRIMSARDWVNATRNERNGKVR